MSNIALHYSIWVNPKVIHSKVPFRVGDIDPMKKMVSWAHMSLQAKWHHDQFSHFCTAHIVPNTDTQSHTTQQ